MCAGTEVERTKGYAKNPTASRSKGCLQAVLTVESRSNVLSSEAQQNTNVRPPSEGKSTVSTVLDMWHTLLRWTITNVNPIDPGKGQSSPRICHKS